MTTSSLAAIVNPAGKVAAGVWLVAPLPILLLLVRLPAPQYCQLITGLFLFAPVLTSVIIIMPLDLKEGVVGDIMLGIHNFLQQIGNNGPWITDCILNNLSGIVAGCRNTDS